MKAVVQRVSKASVKIENEIKGEIGKGLLAYIGFGKEDNEQTLDFMVNKIVNLRIFEDDQGKMNLSAIDKNYSILLISQFTLYGDTHKGFRPSFQDACPPEEAEKLYDLFVKKMKQTDLDVRTGIFRAMMQVESINQGPVTILIEK